MSSRPAHLTVTAVVPAFQAATFLADAVASIRAQVPSVAEIVVVDDGSTDGTAALARSLGGIRLIEQDRRGPGAARNAGVAAATGDWVALLDADDLWLAGKLDRQLAAIARDSQIDGVFTRLRNEFLAPALAQRYRAVEGEVEGIHASTLLVRRTAFARTGGFDEKLRLAEFIDWYSRARHLGLRFVSIPEVLVVRRVHGSNTTIRLRAEAGDYVEAARRAIARHRKRGAGATGSGRS